MNVLIVGAGKTGRRLALALSGRGYDVAVVDRDQSRLDLLGENFDGITVAGVPVDRDVLISAGCENADVACVITPEDNVNVMVTQLLRTDFQVETIYTRIWTLPARLFSTNLACTRSAPPAMKPTICWT